MTKKSWIIMAVMCVAIVGGLVWFSRGKHIDVSKVDLGTIQPATAASGNIADHVYGNAKSKVLIFEYGDYQCPGCGSAYPVLKQVVEKYKDKLGFVFRNKPLTSLHPNALAAASVAEAAGLQGKFWEMHDKLYENQSAWENLSGTERTSYFTSLAASLGLDTAKLNQDINSEAVHSKIAFDGALADKRGVTGTPTIYIGDEDVSDKYVKDGAFVSGGTQDAQLVWGDASAFEKLVVIPALQKAGISVN